MDDRASRVRTAFHRQAETCAELGSPFTAWLCRRLGDELTERTEVGRRVLSWRGDPSSGADSVPLRLCGALYGLALTGRRTHLSALYRDPQPGDEEWREVSTAMEEEPTFLLGLLERTPQTNEVARAAIVYPAFCGIAARSGLPLELLEVGASAGLNLNCDRFAYEIGDWRAGDPSSPVLLAAASHGRSPSEADPVVVARAGCDLAPFDLAQPAEERRLLAYVWPDQAERLARTRAAIEVARRHPPPVERADAVAWLAARLAQPSDGRARIVYSTIAWQYLSGPDRARGEALLSDAGARATAEAPLAWVRFERDDGGPGAALTLDLWNGGRRTRQTLGRGDFHGRWIDWRGFEP